MVTTTRTECHRPLLDAIDDDEQLEITSKQFDHLIEQNLDQNERLNLSICLSEFKAGSCDLSDLLGNLMQNLFAKLNDPIVKYKLLACIRKLYVNDLLYDEPPNNNNEMKMTSRNLNESAKYNLDLKLYDAMMRRYLLASQMGQIKQLNGAPSPLPVGHSDVLRNLIAEKHRLSNNTGERAPPYFVVAPMALDEQEAACEDQLQTRTSAQMMNLSASSSFQQTKLCSAYKLNDNVKDHQDEDKKEIIEHMFASNIEQVVVVQPQVEIFQDQEEEKTACLLPENGFASTNISSIETMTTQQQHNTLSGGGGGHQMAERYVETPNDYYHDQHQFVNNPFVICDQQREENEDERDVECNLATAHINYRPQPDMPYVMSQCELVDDACIACHEAQQHMQMAYHHQHHQQQQHSMPPPSPRSMINEPRQESTFVWPSNPHVRWPAPAPPGSGWTQRRAPYNFAWSLPASPVASRWRPAVFATQQTEPLPSMCRPAEHIFKRSATASVTPHWFRRQQQQQQRQDATTTIRAQSSEQSPEMFSQTIDRELAVASLSPPMNNACQQNGALKFCATNNSTRQNHMGAGQSIEKLTINRNDNNMTSQRHNSMISFDGERVVINGDHNQEDHDYDDDDDEEPTTSVVLVPAQAKGRLPMSVAEQMSEQASKFVQHHGTNSLTSTSTASGQHRRTSGGGNASGSSCNNATTRQQRQQTSYSTNGLTTSSWPKLGANNNNNNNLQVRRTLRVKIRKSRPILGIAIEGGFNVSGQLIPRIVCVHEEGAAYQCGKLRASDLILEVNGTSTVNMTHDEIAKTIANAYYQDERPYIEFLIGESVIV